MRYHLHNYLHLGLNFELFHFHCKSCEGSRLCNASKIISIKSLSLSLSIKSIFNYLIYGCCFDSIVSIFFPTETNCSFSCDRMNGLLHFFGEPWQSIWDFNHFICHLIVILIWRKCIVDIFAKFQCQKVEYTFGYELFFCVWCFALFFFFKFFYVRISAFRRQSALFMHCSRTVYVLFMRHATTLFKKKNFKWVPWHSSHI